VFGPEALIAARPGGRLWVAEGATGTVQSTLKFQSGDEKAALGRLVALDHANVASWTRCEGGTENTTGESIVTGTTVALLDLEAIAVSSEFSLAPVVDVASWGSGRLLIAHRDAVSLLLTCESPEAMIRTLLAGTGSRLHSDHSYLAMCLKEVTALDQASAASTQEDLQMLQLVVEAVASLGDPITRGSSGLGENGLTEELVTTFEAYITSLEDKAEAEVTGGHDQLMHSLMMSPLAHFPSAEGSSIVANPSLSVNSSRIKDAKVEEAVSVQA
jgi:hypothetical protein